LQVGDFEELKAITQAFCKDRKTPLLIGSIKSNMGHSESVSGICGITKVIIAMETGFIPPNLHYKNPREGVESLVNGQLKVNIYITLQCHQNIFILSYT
jgi:fatty acid synthase